MKPKLLRITTSSISLERLLKGQLAFLNDFFEVVGVASGSEGLREVSQREGIRTVEVKMHRPIAPLADFLSLFALIRLIGREKPFFVHANTPKASLLGMTAAWICRVPNRIYTVTGLRFETAEGNFRRLLIGMEKLTCFFATKVIPEGEGVKKTLLREKITGKPLAVLYHGNMNGIDPDYFSRKEEVIEAAKENRTEEFTFCYVGRMVRDKGIQELLRAFVRLHEKSPHLRLLMVGPLEQELDPVDQETLDLLLHHPAISYTGFQQDVRPFLAASDVFVFPSYREGFPNVVLQAGAMGLPCIVTDISGSNEIIIHDVNGLIIPPRETTALANAMEELFLKKDERHSMASNARKMVITRYNRKDVWEAILKMYRELSGNFEKNA